jgi:hypothetical protein
MSILSGRLSVRRHRARFRISRSYLQGFGHCTVAVLGGITVWQAIGFFIQ